MMRERAQSSASGLRVGVSYGAPSVIGPAKGISQSGTPKVLIKYAPEAGDKSTKIVFIQVMRELLDGTATKPGTIVKAFDYQDADTTADFYHVDYKKGEKDPYYNGDDPEDAGSLQIQGNATSSPKVTAQMDDTPDFQDAWMPAGKSKVKWEFQTFAFSAAGADKGKFHAHAKWTFDKEKGKASTISHDGEATGAPPATDKTAIDLWCTNHGFTLPK